MSVSSQAKRWTVGMLARGVIVQHEHREAPAVAGFRVFEHLPVADRIAEGGV